MGGGKDAIMRFIDCAVVASMDSEKGLLGIY
jgi:hypothetical protein